MQSSNETGDAARAPDNDRNSLALFNSTIQSVAPSPDDAANLPSTFSFSTASPSVSSSVDIHRTRSGRLVTLPSKLRDYSLT